MISTVTAPKGTSSPERAPQPEQDARSVKILELSERLRAAVQNADFYLNPQRRPRNSPRIEDLERNGIFLSQDELKVDERARVEQGNPEEARRLYAECQGVLSDIHGTGAEEDIHWTFLLELRFFRDSLLYAMYPDSK